MIDLFSGTGSVSNFFLKNGCKVTSCDNMTYSIAEQYRINYFKTEPDFSEIMHIVGSGKLKEVLKHLNELIPIKGYYFDNYAPSGYYNRKYFSDNNAKKMDAISNELEKIKPFLSYEKYMFLNGIFMCGCDRVSNTAGTYGAFLKIWRSMALKNIILELSLIHI